MKYAIATFSIGPKYHTQTNRLIRSFDGVDNPPTLYILTDESDRLLKRHFIKYLNILDYEPEYQYVENYYDFDFSIKRYSLKQAFDDGYEHVILTDTDAELNIHKYDIIPRCFIPNSISGQVTYTFNENSELGDRFKKYEELFDVYFNKNEIYVMPEDCIQFISIEGDRRHKFIDTWSKCIEYKKVHQMGNIPAGNIDEMCFAALYNGIDLNNNSHIEVNMLVAKHDKWYI